MHGTINQENEKEASYLSKCQFSHHVTSLHFRTRTALHQCTLKTCIGLTESFTEPLLALCGKGAVGFLLHCTICIAYQREFN